MSILINKNTRSSPRALPARPASSTREMPGVRQRQGLLRRRRQSQEGRRSALFGIPIFGTVMTAAQTGATVSVIYVPPPARRRDLGSRRS